MHATSTPGFIVNRCARPFYGEALRLLAEGAADAATIDAVLRAAGGFRMGAFELMDLIGNDVNFAVTRSVWEACYYDPRYAPSVLQQERVAAGLLRPQERAWVLRLRGRCAAAAAGDTRCASVCRCRRRARRCRCSRAARRAHCRRRRRRRSGVPRSMHSPMARVAGGRCGAGAFRRTHGDHTRERDRHARTSCSSISRSTIRRANAWPSPPRMDAPPVRSVLRQALCSAPGSPCRGSTMSPASRCCASSRRSPTRRRTP